MSEPWTIGSILQWTTQYFRDKGVDNPRLDADVLLSFLLGKDRLYLYVHFDQPLLPDELAAFREMVRQRAARIPVAYIIGRKEFMGLSFQVSPAVLIPRPETEVLVEAALARMSPAAGGRVLDVGTGSGAILVGVLSRLPQWQGVGCDISPAALEVAAANAKRLLPAGQAHFLQADLFPTEPDLFDAILSNPPYITEDEMKRLPPEVLKEPELALCGGPDGLDFYRRLLAEGHNRLKPDGFLALEAGAGQIAHIIRLAEQHGWRQEQTLADYAGIDRVLVLRLSHPQEKEETHENHLS